MYSRSRLRRPVNVPKVTTTKTVTKDCEYNKGINTNLSNDDMPTNQWRYVTDARETRIGEWTTRKGTDLFSIPIGETVNASVTSTSGAGDVSFGVSNWFAQKVTAVADGNLTGHEANIKNASDATGTIVLALYSDNGGPSIELASTTIKASVVTSSYAYCMGRFITCPSIVNGTSYWIVGYVQAGGSGSYSVSSTTSASTGETSTTSGSTWTSQSYALNVRLSTATASGCNGSIRIRRPNGASYTFFAHSTNVYSVVETTGATSLVDSGLSGASTYCRFEFVSDVLYYVTGQQKPRKYDFTSAAEVTTAPENAAGIIQHKGVVFYVSSDDPEKVFYTNFGIYETFTSTDFFYVPAPKTSDPVKAEFNIMGNLYFCTRNDKYVLYGSENATFRLDNAVGQKGTYSQESVAFDQNFAYIASDDGIYQFNGTQEKNIAEDVLDTWTGILKKENTVLELRNNRLYVFYTENGSAINSACLVYNIAYDIWESKDLNMYVGGTYSRFDTNDYFLLASNRVGMLMLAEQSTNDYTNMGEPLTYELRTRYEHYETPAQLKRAPMYRPHFTAQSGNYSVEVGYAVDYRDVFTATIVSVQATGPKFGSGVRWGDGSVYGSSKQLNPMDSSLRINGEWRRLQIRYAHHAAREPISFDGHVLTIETQRLI